MTGTLWRFDRGSWLLTQYSINVQDFCLVLYIKNDFWYEAWIKHVINVEETKNKCFNLGVRWLKLYQNIPHKLPFIYFQTKFVHETYPLQPVVPTQDSGFEGLYKSQIKFQAMGGLHKVRPTSICFEIKAHLERQ